MAVYEVNGKKYEIPDNVQGNQLVSVLEELNAQIESAAPKESRFKDIAADVGTGESLAISAGKGLYDIGRGIGLVDDASQTEKEAFAELERQKPVTTFVGETLGQAAPFAVPSLAVGAIPSTAGRVAGSTLLGATEGGIIADAEGQEFIEGAGIGGVVAGTAEAIFPVLGRLSRKTFNSLTGRTPKGALVDAKGNPTSEMQDALDRAGLTWEDMKVSAQDMIMSQQQGVSPEEAARMARFEQIGAPYTKGQITKDFAQRKKEQALLESEEAIASDLREIGLKQSDAIRNELSGVVDNLGVSGDTGSALKDALSSRKKMLKEDKNALYKKLGEEAQQLESVPVMTEGIFNALPDARLQRRVSKLAPSQYESLKDLLVEYGVDQSPEAVEDAMAQGIKPEMLGLSNFEEFRQDLNRIASSDISGSISMIIDPLKKALDDEINIASNALEGAGGDIAQLAKDARIANTIYKTEFDEAKITSKLIDSVKRGSTQPKIEASQAYNKIMAKSAPIENLERVMESLRAQGGLGKQAVNEMQSKAVLDLLDSAFSAQSRQVKGARVFGGTPYSKQFESLKPKLDILFSGNKKDLAKLENVYNIAQDIIPPAGATPKGSAGFFIDALNKIGLYSVASKAPALGPLLEVMRSYGEKSKSRAFVEKAINAKPKVKELAWSLDRDYPQLAASIGIAGISKTDENKEQGQ